MSPDQINGTFEFAGAMFLLLNCWKTYKAKQVHGVSIWSTSFFMSWGIWNLYYYPHLNQYWSFAGGIAIVITNILWISLMIYYSRKMKNGF